MLRDYAVQKRPMAGAHRRQVYARPVDYKWNGRRLYAGWIGDVEALFIGKVENGLRCFEAVTTLG